MSVAHRLGVGGGLELISHLVQLGGAHLRADDCVPVPAADEILRARRPLLLKLRAELRQASDPVEPVTVVAHQLILNKIHDGVERGLQLLLVHWQSLSDRRRRIVLGFIGVNIAADPDGHLTSRAPWS
jgi:hypothetical protein